MNGMSWIIKVITARSALILKLIDVVVITGLVQLNATWLGVETEPLAKALVVSFSYVLFLHAFDFYNYERFERSRVWYAIVLAIAFSVAVSILVQVGFYFRPTGRKVMLLHSVCMILYLGMRGRLMLGLQDNIVNMFVLPSGAKNRLRPEVLSLLNASGRIVDLADSETGNGRKFVRLYYVVDHPESLSEADIQRLLQLKLQGYRVLSQHSFHELFFKQIPVDRINSNFFFELNSFHRANRLVYAALRRFFDFVFALALLMLLSPLLLFVGILIRLDSKGPALFKQTRTGRNGKPFTIVKFRSMRLNAEPSGAVWSTDNDDRITRVGNIIRKLRIDELPQLLNILKGDMGFIGPRPERPEFDEQLKETIPYYMFRYLVKPGLTGWAQINYGYCSTEEDANQKLQYDLYYVKNYSFQLDVEILVRTAKIVLFARGR